MLSISYWMSGIVQTVRNKQQRRHEKVDENTKFDYYYGIEADQFSFYRVPRLLIKDERFKGLSSDAKLLYGLMLDRMSLSMKNGWLDEENRAYIIYTVDAIMEDLGCAKATCVKIMKELDSEKGIGLIEKKRRGLGKPDIIYVKNFATMSEETAEKMSQNNDKSTEVQNVNLQKYNKQTFVGSEIEPTEVQKLVPNYTNYNQTNPNHTEESYIYPINPSEAMETEDNTIDVMDDAQAYIELIKENISYEHHMKYDKYGQREIYDELFEVICEVVCVKRQTIRVAGEEYPYELVKARFLKLNSSHLEYVIGCMKETTTKITNIKAYMVTALYNAPTTINHFYQQEVQHDMYGGGWHEKGIV
jgi:predicted transcriptional regulator